MSNVKFLNSLNSSIFKIFSRVLCISDGTGLGQWVKGFVTTESYMNIRNDDNNLIQVWLAGAMH